ncbi:MAG: UDP-N-acetylmuramate--L-alanine ligase [Phycisphaeraceae bacterium]|nr:UDP-N-acetylmuramate--L-alanine ligase [Phycisphaeraceae bacterium]
MPHGETPSRESALERLQRGQVRGSSLWFTGVGGCGMSALARLFAERGAHCAGSDRAASPVTLELTARGVPVAHDQDRGELPEECDVVIASAAIAPDHPELIAAQRRGIPVIGYAEALGGAQSGRTSISIAGTHGKSTTTAMLAHLLVHAGLDPSVIVGAHCEQLGGGSRLGAETIPSGPRRNDPGILVAEACEFNRSFHHHRPVLALINNIEEDHLDCYGSLDEIIASFRHFAERLPPAARGGRLLIAHEGAHRREVTAGLACEWATFGWDPSADYVVALVDEGDQVERGQSPPQRLTQARITHKGEEIARLACPMPGLHNVLNTAAATILALWLGAERSAVEEAVSNFAGLDRRSQRLGERRLPGGGRVVVYDDYGHHPTECEKTLTALAARERPERLICVFQPHQHSRTRFLLEHFAQSFSVCDLVIVPPIYFVRDSEQERTRVSADDLVDRLREKGVHAIHLNPFEAIVEHLEVVCRDGDLLVVMGAGPVGSIAYDFLRGPEGRTDRPSAGTLRSNAVSRALDPS